MKKGFTLLEVLIAVVILATGIVVVASAWSGNFLRIRRTNLYNNVATLLERKITEKQAEFYGKPIAEITDDSGDFGAELPQYRWEFKTKDFEMPDLSAAVMGEQGRVDDTLLMMVKQTADYLSESVKEGTVSVFVKFGPTETEYSVTTYFIDYSKEISLPGLPGGPGGDGK